MSKKIVRIELEYEKPRDLEIKLNRIYDLLIQGREMYENPKEYRDHYVTFCQFYKIKRNYIERKESDTFVHIVESKIK